MAFSSLHIHSNHILIRNNVLGSRSPGLIAAMFPWLSKHYTAGRLNAILAFAVHFVAGEKCSHHHRHGHRHTLATTCQASDSEQVVDRRSLLGAGISLAAAAQLKAASPADALVVSKEWEKVLYVLCAPSSVHFGFQP